MSKRSKVPGTNQTVRNNPADDMVTIKIKVRRSALKKIDEVVEIGKRTRKKFDKSSVIRLAIERYIVLDMPAYFEKKKGKND